MQNNGNLGLRPRTTWGSVFDDHVPRGHAADTTRQPKIGSQTSRLYLFDFADIFRARTNGLSDSLRGQTRTNADKSRTKQIGEDRIKHRLAVPPVLPPVPLERDFC